MAKRSHKPEEIVSKLRQVDVLHSQGVTMLDAIRQIDVSEVTLYRWRKESGGMKADLLTLGQQYFGLPQHANDLLWCVSLPAHLILLNRVQISRTLSIALDQF